MRALYEEYKIILERKAEPLGEDKSYTKYLFKSGINKIVQKVGEEATEVIIAAKDASAGGASEPVIAETADLLYHVLIMLAELGIPLSDIEAELETRMGKIGNLRE